ncbi:Holliday junction resolvase RuvX [Parapedobacter sp.]
MAFDYGTKRVGIAVTDPLQLIATALDTVHAKDVLAYVKGYLDREGVSTFVVGEPRQLDGSESESAQHVRGFVRMLRRTFPAIPVETVDERFTSKMASASIAQSGMAKKNGRTRRLSIAFRRCLSCSLTSKSVTFNDKTPCLRTD